MWVASLHLAIGQPDSQSGMDWTGHLVNSFRFSLSLIWLSHRDAGLSGPYFPSLKHSGFCQPPGNCKKTPGPASYPLVLLYLQLQDGGFFVCVCFYFCSCLFVCLVVFNCSGSADLDRNPKHLLGVGPAWTPHLSVAPSLLPPRQYGLHTGGDPWIPHCSRDVHWLFTCPPPCHNTYFSHCSFLPFV